MHIATRSCGLATAAVVFGIMLTACGSGGGFGTATSSSAPSGGSGTGGTTPNGTTATPARLLLTTTAPSSTGAMITATVTDSSNVAIGNETVSFSASCSNNCTLGTGATTTASDGTATTTISAQSAGTVTITAKAGSLLQNLSISIPAAADYKLGTLDASGTFTAGTIALGETTVPAGGSSGLQVVVYDPNNKAAYSNGATVAFSSNCISGGTATAPSVTNSSGTFNSTYTAKGCSGNDTITATATLADGTTLTATNTITVQAATLGSVIFDGTDTTATSVALKGSGQGETADIYFQVLDQSGNPVSGATVNFSLTATPGGLTLSPSSQKSGSDGKVHTTVSAGTVHTVVRVVASTTSGGQTLTTQSSLLTVSTGFPTENGFSLSASKLNIEGNNIDGVTTIITARLSDRYNNPVPDGTAVSFQSECGDVQPQCTTSGGACSVTFTSQSPRTRDLVANNMASSYDWYQRLKSNPNAPKCNGTDDRSKGCNDHRCTVLATAIGEESFTDCNGSGVYISKLNPNNNATQCPNGDDFVSLSEAFQDNNENAVLDSTETFQDFNSNGQFDPADGKFIGLLCGSDPNCDSSSSLNIYKSIQIVMSGSTATIGHITPVPVGNNGIIDIPVTDDAGQFLPVGTTIKATYTKASGVSPQGDSYTVANTDACPSPVPGCSTGISATYEFGYTLNTAGTPGTITITVTTPGGNQTAGTVSPPKSFVLN